QIVLARLGEALEADITVFASDGEPIASVGNPVAFPVPGEREDIRSREDRRILSARLADGRMVVARFDSGSFGPPRARPLLWLALIAAAIGAVAWPVVRRLTGRRERLRRGVETWGMVIWPCVFRARARTRWRRSLPASIMRPDASRNRSPPTALCSPMPATNCAHRLHACAWQANCMRPRPIGSGAA